MNISYSVSARSVTDVAARGQQGRGNEPDMDLGTDEAGFDIEHCANVIYTPSSVGCDLEDDSVDEHSEALVVMQDDLAACGAWFIDGNLDTSWKRGQELAEKWRGAAQHSEQHKHLLDPVEIKSSTVRVPFGIDVSCS